MRIDMDPRQKQMLDDVFDAFTMLAGGNYVSLMHVQGGYTRYTPAYADLVGLPGEYIANGAMDWADYVHPEDRRRYLDVMGSLLSSGSHNYDLTYRFRTRNGEYVNGRFIGAVIRDESGEPVLVGGMTINQGLTETTDPVTLLPNRNAFFRDLGEMMGEDREVVALKIGIGSLTELNRVYGWSYGDRALQETAFLIQETVKDRGSVYRTSGASFVFLTDRLGRQEAAAIYDTIRLKMQRGIRVEGIRTILSANGGLISARGPRMEPATVWSCLDHVYRESGLRRNGELVDFNGSIDYDVRASLEMVNTIRDCILDGCRGFYIDYQPMVGVSDERPVGLEALIRWKGEPYGEVLPLRFVPLLEKDFVFEELAEWIFRRVMTDGLELLRRDPDLIVSVNVSSAQLEDEYFIDGLEQILEETGYPADRFCVEVTKGCRLLELDRLKKIVDSLHALGIRIVIDDFGTGFESISFLKKLSADFIKFDRELVEGIEDDPEDRQTVEHLSRLAAARGASVCIKGVETAGMRDILRGFDVDCMQGDLYAHPEPFDDILRDLFDKKRSAET